MGGIKILKLTNRFLKKEEEQSLNECLNVKNIKENFLYTLDGQVIQSIKVEPINIELLTDDELESKMNFSSIEFSEKQQPYKILVIPRAVDIDDKSIDLVVMDPQYLLNMTKVKKTSTFNNYANELIGLKDGFDLQILDLLIPKMKKINIYIYCSKRQVRDLLDYFIKLGCN